MGWPCIVSHWAVTSAYSMMHERQRFAWVPLRQLIFVRTAGTGKSCILQGAPVKNNPLENFFLYLCNCSTFFNTHTRLTAPCPGLLKWAGTRKVKPNWILLKQETVSGSGVSWAICKSAAPCSRQITMPALHYSVFTCRMPFLPPNQQHQSTEGHFLSKRDFTAKDSDHACNKFRKVGVVEVECVVCRSRRCMTLVCSWRWSSAAVGFSSCSSCLLSSTSGFTGLRAVNPSLTNGLLCSAALTICYWINFGNWFLVDVSYSIFCSFSALTLLIGRQEGRPACKSMVNATIR